MYPVSLPAARPILGDQFHRILVEVPIRVRIKLCTYELTSNEFIYNICGVSNLSSQNRANSLVSDSQALSTRLTIGFFFSRQTIR